MTTSHETNADVATWKNRFSFDNDVNKHMVRLVAACVTRRCRHRIVNALSTELFEDIYLRAK